MARTMRNLRAKAKATGHRAAKRLPALIGVGLLLGAGLASAPGSAGPRSNAKAVTGDAYRSTLANGRTPGRIVWAGRAWRVNAGSTVMPGMDHTLRIGSLGRKLRFELRNTGQDKAFSDRIEKRRAEISGSLPGDRSRLANGVPLWGAMSFNHHGWADPAGMRALMGGVYGQIHMGSVLGGSPALAFRRSKRGEFKITTRGEEDSAGSTRWEAPLSFDRVHHLVYRIVLHPQRGSLAVWLDGVQIVDVREASIGSRYADSYFNVGLYFSGGITSPVVAEYANLVYPAPMPLSKLVAAPPAWPAG